MTTTERLLEIRAELLATVRRTPDIRMFQDAVIAATHDIADLIEDIERAELGTVTQAVLIDTPKAKNVIAPNPISNLLLAGQIIGLDPREMTADVLAELTRDEAAYDEYMLERASLALGPDGVV